MLRPLTAALLVFALAGCVRDPVGTGEPQDIAFMKKAKTNTMQLVREVPANIDGHGQLAIEGRLSVAGTLNGYYIWDEKDREDPSFHPVPGATGSVALFNSIAYIARVDGMELIDVSDPGNPQSLAFYPHTCGSDRHTLVLRENSTVVQSISAPHNTACAGTFGVLTVPKTDPNAGIWRYRPSPGSLGCFNFVTHAATNELIALCANGSVAQNWDITDLFNPNVVAIRAAPLAQQWISGSTSSDGTWATLHSDAGLIELFEKPGQGTVLQDPPKGSIQIPRQFQGEAACEGGFVPNGPFPQKHTMTVGCGAEGTFVIEFDVLMVSDWSVRATGDRPEEAISATYFDKAVRTVDRQSGVRIYKPNGFDSPKETRQRVNPGAGG